MCCMRREHTGVLGRMSDVLGSSMSVGQIAIDKPLSNLVGDPSLGRKVDILSSPIDLGVEQFFRVSGNIPGVSHSVPYHIVLFFLCYFDHEYINISS